MNTDWNGHTGLTVSHISGVGFLEGTPGTPQMRSEDDARLLVEACLSNRVRVALLYAPNLTEQFFDLSSREAGNILQMLRNYRIRLAVVCPPGSVRFSRLFGQMVAEERRGNEFRVFDSAEAAREWIAAPGSL